MVGSTQHCLQLSQHLLEPGINVFPIIFPAVPEHAARLRFFINCPHTEAQLRFAVETLTQSFRVLA